MTHTLQILLLLIIIVACAKAAGALSVRLGQPAVFGEILVGLILGPTVLDLLHWNVLNVGSTHPASGPLQTLLDAVSFSDGQGHALYLEALIRDLAEIGVLLLMFVAGLETDLVAMKKVGAAAFWAATGGVTLPLFFGAGVAVAFGHPLFWTAILIGTILTATSVSISAQTLMELGALRSKEGTTILGAAVIDDVQGLILLGFVTALTASTGAGPQAAGAWEIGWIIGRMTLFFAVFWVFGRKVLPSLTSKARTIPASEALLAFALIVALIYGWAAEYLAGLAAITGSYMAGVLLAQTEHHDEIKLRIHPLTYSLFVPIFFVGIGLAANGRKLGGSLTWLGAIVAVAILTKVVGCIAGARLAGFSAREALRVGIGMISRGEVGLITAGIGLSRGIIDQNVFSTMVVMVLVTTMITPILLRFVFPRVEHAPVHVYESISHVEE